jgi:hypothetical protein
MVADDDDGDSKLGYLSDKMHKIRLRLWMCKQLDKKVSIMVAQYKLRGVWEQDVNKKICM